MCKSSLRNDIIIRASVRERDPEIEKYLLLGLEISRPNEGLSWLNDDLPKKNFFKWCHVNRACLKAQDVVFVDSVVLSLRHWAWMDTNTGALVDTTSLCRIVGRFVLGWNRGPSKRRRTRPWEVCKIYDGCRQYFPTMVIIKRFHIRRLVRGCFLERLPRLSIFREAISNAQCQVKHAQLLSSRI